jgi:Protein of unknown function (DUF3558)
VIGTRTTVLRVAVTAATLVACCVACSQVVPGTASSVDDSAPAAAADDTSTGGADVDPCALVTADDLAPLVGAVEGKRTDASYTSICDWKGRGGSSVEVVVGAVGSAPDNAVPDDPILHPKPVGDGFSATSSGLVEFAAGERVYIVSVDLDGKTDRDRGTQLARAVRGRV